MSYIKTYFDGIVKLNEMFKKRDDFEDACFYMNEFLSNIVNLEYDNMQLNTDQLLVDWLNGIQLLKNAKFSDEFIFEVLYDLNDSIKVKEYKYKYIDDDDEDDDDDDYEYDDDEYEYEYDDDDDDDDDDK